MGIFDFFSKKRKQEFEPQVRASGSYDVTIPEEKYVVANVQLDGKPYVCVLNDAITALTPKDPFQWYLSLVIHFENHVGDDMPDKEDTVKMQDFSDFLCSRLTDDKNHPNALLLGRITGDGKTQIMWYVNNPEKANSFLQALISSKNYPFQFDFVMQPDPDWKEAHYWLDPLKN